MLVRIANSKDPDQTVSGLGLCCSSRPFQKETGVRNFKIFTVSNKYMITIATVLDLIL